MVIVVANTPEMALRVEWGQILAEVLGAAGVSRKELQRRLAASGNPVSIQAIGQWLQGKTSPRPSMQAAVADALNVPARVLFPLPRRVAS